MESRVIICKFNSTYFLYLSCTNSMPKYVKILALGTSESLWSRIENFIHKYFLIYRNLKKMLKIARTCCRICWKTLKCYWKNDKCEFLFLLLLHKLSTEETKIHSFVQFMKTRYFSWCQLMSAWLRLERFWESTLFS